MSISPSAPPSAKPSGPDPSRSPPSPSVERSPAPLVRRGRKPSRILYPPLGRKRWPRREADAAQRCFLILAGLMVLQILMEEAGQGDEVLTEDQWLGASSATPNLRALSNSSGDGRAPWEKTSSVFTVDLESEHVFEDPTMTPWNTRWTDLQPPEGEGILDHPCPPQKKKSERRDSEAQRPRA